MSANALAELLEDAAPAAHFETESERRNRFYDEMEDEKTEFMNGEVIVHSPTTFRHISVRRNLLRLLEAHVEFERLGIVQDEKALCVFPRNDYEPDICFFGPEKEALICPETLKFPIPDFICEVLSGSTESRDRGVKFRDYEAHGVKEYWIIDPEAEVLEQYVIKDGSFELRLKSGTGAVESCAIGAFQIPIRALFDKRESFRCLRTLFP